MSGRARRAVHTVLVVCLVGLLGLQACARQRPASGITHTPLGVAQKTFPEELSAVQRGVQTTLGALGMPVREVRSLEEGGRLVRSEIVASARDRRVVVTIERLTDAATRVNVDVQQFLLKDKATATAVLAEIDDALSRR